MRNVLLKRKAFVALFVMALAGMMLLPLAAWGSPGEAGSGAPVAPPQENVVGSDQNAYIVAPQPDGAIYDAPQAPSGGFAYQAPDVNYGPVAPSAVTDKDILSFSLAGVPGTITGTTITLTVPAGTNVASLEPAIAISGASFSPHGPQDFSRPVTYTVTAQDGSTKAYTVLVTAGGAAATSDKDITSFVINDAPGSISDTAITVDLPYGSAVTALTPVVAITGASYSPAGPQNFTSPVTYTVTAQDGSTKAYVVTVTVDATPPFTILSNFPTYTGSEAIWGQIEAPAAIFQGLMLNNDVIDPANYTVAASDGSTVITLKDAYLKTLANGPYNVRALFDNGYADLYLLIEVPQTPADININEAGNGGSGSGSGMPTTGDVGSAVLAGALLASALGAFGLLTWHRRQQAARREDKASR